MLEITDGGDITTVAMAQGKVNALDLELLLALTAAFRDRRDDPRPIVFTGSGRAFSAGVDLHRIVRGGPEYVGAFMPALSDAFLAVFEHPGPVVAAVNGHALAGGCILAAACDMRVAVDGGGTIGVTEVLVGVPFPTVPLEIVRCAVGTTAASSLALTGARLSMADAAEIGLITHLVERAEALFPAATEVAMALGSVESPAFTTTKLQLRRPTLERITAHRAADDVTVNAAWASPATTGAISRYLDGLKPRG